MSDALADRVRLRIRVEMVRRQLSATQLAARLGVDAMWLSRRLRGTTELNLSELDRLAAALDVDTDTLLKDVA